MADELEEEFEEVEAFNPIVRGPGEIIEEQIIEDEEPESEPSLHANNQTSAAAHAEAAAQPSSPEPQAAQPTA